MKILAIETSNKPLSVAVLEDQNLYAETKINYGMGKDHSKNLMPLIDATLQEAHLTIQEIDRLVVAKGPGSYTGLRIGATTAKTLAYTLDKELSSVSSLEVLAQAYPQTDAILVPVFDARRDNVFAGAYTWQDGKLVNVLADAHISITDLQAALRAFDQEIIFIGQDALNLKEKLSQDFPAHFAEQQFAYPSAYVLGLVGQKRDLEAIDTFVPAYLRLTQAERQWLDQNPQKDNNDDSYVQRV
ncbi:tRNA (adenosine(37)-N6)-threonylcarbamoyltransferase complex dimerization subunit type 1 TsaB [Ligilactobacillus equi]